MASQPLTLRYRPRKFSDMVGQGAARVLLMQMVRKDKVPPALLLHGSWGSGKTTSARIVAAALNCEDENPESRPCGGCVTCQAIVAGKSADVIEIDAASSGLAEDMRELRQQVRVQALSRYRVVVLDECHELTAKGQQTLLKVLEEPPPNVVFILATTNVDSVLDTISSRCFLVQFQRITVKDIAARLFYIAQQEKFSLMPDLAEAIANRSQGAMRDAVMLLDQCMLVGISTPDELVAMSGDTDVAVRMLSFLAANDYASAHEVTREGLETLPSPADLMARVVDTLQRMLVLTSGDTAGVLSPPPTKAERELAEKLDSSRLLLAMRFVWDYHRSVLPVSDAFTAMSLLLSRLLEALSPRVSHSVQSGLTSSNSPAASNTSVRTPSSAGSVDEFLASDKGA